MLKWFKKMRARRIQDETLREKTLANIDNEPWISVVDVGFEIQEIQKQVILNLTGIKHLFKS